MVQPDTLQLLRRRPAQTLVRSDHTTSPRSRPHLLRENKGSPSARAAYTEARYTPNGVAIRSFATDDVKIFFERGRIPRRSGWSAIARIVARKLDMLDYATRLRDLSAPPGNRLEALEGHWHGFHSIRVNDQWRIVFRWSDLGPQDVDVIDYH